MSRKKNYNSGRVINRNSMIANEGFNESAYDNNRGWMMYVDKLCELSTAMFEWKNLPKEIDPIYLEKCLFWNGGALFFEEDVLKQYVVTRFAGQGQFDIYGIPKVRVANANNGYHRKLTDKESVIIYNNMLRSSSQRDVFYFAKRLYKLDRIIDINTNAQKTPVAILCDEKQRLTLKQLYMKYDGNEPFIFGDKLLLSNNPIQAINTGAPFVADKILEIKNNIWNEALTYLGISNINIAKKERMITDEVTRNQGGTIANRYSRLNARRRACEQINEMFGLNIECNYREDFEERILNSESDTQDETEVEESEKRNNNE